MDESFMQSRRLIVLAGALGLAGMAAAPAPVTAQAVLDQEQAAFVSMPDGPHLAIGSDSEQKLAQTVTAGRNGALSRIDLPVACVGSGDLVVRITDVTRGGEPGSRVLSTTRVPAERLLGTVPPSFSEIPLDAPVTMTSGQRFAITLEVAGPRCTLSAGPDGDPYGRGTAFFDARPNPPGWAPLRSISSPYDDLPFKTWVDVGTSGGAAGFCTLSSGPLHLGGPGPVTLPFPAWVPACRCFTDPGLRGERCGLFLPELVLIRETPRPIASGQQFALRWILVPLVDGPETPLIIESLPQGFSPGQELKIDFGRNLKAYSPVVREFPLVAGEESNLDDWRIEYRWQSP